MEENIPLVKIVVSYAREDLELLNQLKKQLKPLIREGNVVTWDDSDILAGREWSTEIDTRLQTAHIILLLISADFIASDYCYNSSVRQALERHEKGEAHVLPIILRSVGWEQTLFGKLQPLPSNGHPIISSRWQYIDEAFKDVADSIQKIVTSVRAKIGQKIFVSYSQNDKDFVYALVEKLKNETEYYVLIDRELGGNQLWWDTVLDKIDECEFFVPILTQHYAASVYYKQQLDYALALKKTILPLILQPFELPPSLQAISLIDISALSLDDAFLHMRRALINIETDVWKRGYASKVKVQRPNNPIYPITSHQIFPTFPATGVSEKNGGSQTTIEPGRLLAQEAPHLFNKQASYSSESMPKDKPMILVAIDGKLMQLIPASKFLFSDRQMLELPDFYIDTWPVTNKEYMNFLLEQNLAPPATWKKKKFPKNQENHPVAGVSWYEAMAYARWARKRLPTAAEWEKAARGTDGRFYPWGEMFDVQRCNTLESNRKTSTPVIQHQNGASIYGVLDMAGNVWEWTTDEVAPLGRRRQSHETKRVLKGGSWNTPKGSAACAEFTSTWPHEQFIEAGFRCVLPINASDA